MGSHRLPGKSMAPLAGIPLISHVIARVKATSLPMDVIVATTNQPADDVLAAHVESLGVRVYRGSETDVLGRMFWAAELYPTAEAIVRICADDPFQDPELLDTLVGLFLAEWATNPDTAPPYMAIGGPSWPIGLGAEVMTRVALTDAHQHANTPDDREHVTGYLIRQGPAWFLKNPTGKGGAHLRWTIDDATDLSFAVKVYDHLYARNPVFGLAAMAEAGYC